MTLPSVPDALVPTREALHQVAYFVLAPARFRRTGRMGLVPTPGGFGTPDLGGRVLRIDGDLLVDEKADAVASATVASVGEAAAFFDEPYVVDWFEGFGDPLPPLPSDQPLVIDADASRFVGALFALGSQAIDRFSSVVAGGITEMWIWPEHFDIATEAGGEGAGGKASFGASPGDHAHDEPYFYVSAWGEIDRAESFWNDRAFNGASLAYADMQAASDPVERVVEFFMAGFDLLNPS